MKRFISALAFCVLLLVALSLFLFPPAEAKEDPIAVLLSLPAPPPPNPLVERSFAERDPKFYDKRNPPKDNAPMSDLLAYWSQIAAQQNDLRYSPEPSERTLQRIKTEIEKDPRQLGTYLNLFKKDPEWVKGIYDSLGTTSPLDKEDRKTIRRWLLYNSHYYSNDLARLAENAGDTTDYVSNQEEVLALARVDFETARPIINRLYNDPSAKASRVLARWALYRHALDTDSLGDIEQYRDELKAIVEDKNAGPGMRDLALDALVGEKEWSGRDEWYFSLLGDETLSELKVNGSTYTGLTTLMLNSPDDKYTDKMLELVKSGNSTVRAAAIRNLLTRIDGGGPEVVKAFLPWLEDPNWAKDTGDSRAAIVRKLGEYEIPESVPGLISILGEITRPSPSRANSNSATLLNVNKMSNVNGKPGSDPVYAETNYNPLRYAIVQALGKQRDPRAVPALRRVLPESSADYDRSYVIKAILDCGGFTVAEQLDALENAAKGVRSEMEAEAANISHLEYGPTSNINAVAGGRTFQIGGPEMTKLLGQQLLASDTISDDLARALVDRIEGLDKTDRRTAAAYRRMILKWQNAAINLLLLSDVKRGNADSDTVIRLLSQRKDLREKQGPDVFDTRTGTHTAVGISACLIEDAGDYDGILQSGDDETKTAMLACARLIRAKLPVTKVAENLGSATPALGIAAERYLESEDSPEARAIVLSRHPGEAKILGATHAFRVEGVEDTYSQYLWALYLSLDNEMLYNGWGGSSNDEDLAAVERSVRAEVKKDDSLLGIYAYDGNYIRFYKDRVLFSWDEDDSRYRERPLTAGEVEYIRSYFIDNKADELPPFLACGGAYCEAKELIMVGRNGGRRVYTNGESDFFRGLDNYFAELKKTPAALRYALSREIPQLEIVLASDDLHVETVWKNGNDLRVCASQTSVRKRLKEQIEKLDDDEEVGTGEGAAEQLEKKKSELKDKHRYDGFAWYRLASGNTQAAEQPPGIDYIPVRDGLAIQGNEESWKARAPGIEIRTAESGLYKVAGGRLARMLRGDYQYPVITPNGRWVLAYKTDADKGTVLVRVDLWSSREYPIEVEGYGEAYPQAYVPTLGKVLVVRDESYDEEPYYSAEEQDDDRTAADDDPSNIMLVDPANGMVFPAAAELRPLSQQTFRPLQKAPQADEYWAAMPDFEKNQTRLGIYNAKWLTFKPVRTIPKIKFNSMDMWVDEPGNKVYFVYRGHLLALPVKNG